MQQTVMAVEATEGLAQTLGRALAPFSVQGDVGAPLAELLHAPLRFFQLYVLRGGFLDGYPGLMVCGIMSFYAFLKDIKLWGLEHTVNAPAGYKAPEPAALGQRRAA